MSSSNVFDLVDTHFDSKEELESIWNCYNIEEI